MLRYAEAKLPMPVQCCPASEAVPAAPHATAPSRALHNQHTFQLSLSLSCCSSCWCCMSATSAAAAAGTALVVPPCFSVSSKSCLDAHSMIFGSRNGIRRLSGDSWSFT
eukprot:GHRQ01026480.1.p1 GENE.GHRQ01026480.1~~GHRQ01026480.1.p1  ORF type:complete len:109 (-),score=10.29 GHRQ01026480.1:97-423(-)